MRDQAFLTARSMSGSIDEQMASYLKIDTGMMMVRRVPRALRAHAFVSAIILGVLLGGGLRLVPTGAAAATGSNVAGQEVAASTACAAP